jgi:hypothetical protein
LAAGSVVFAGRFDRFRLGFDRFRLGIPCSCWDFVGVWFWDFGGSWFLFVVVLKPI